MNNAPDVLIVAINVSGLDRPIVFPLTEAPKANVWHRLVQECKVEEMLRVIEPDVRRRLAEMPSLAGRFAEVSVHSTLSGDVGPFRWRCADEGEWVPGVGIASTPLLDLRLPGGARLRPHPKPRYGESVFWVDADWREIDGNCEPGRLSARMAQVIDAPYGNHPSSVVWLRVNGHATWVRPCNVWRAE